jgi:DNA-binding XRE family transcriptional regulator
MGEAQPPMDPELVERSAAARFQIQRRYGPRLRPFLEDLEAASPFAQALSGNSGVYPPKQPIALSRCLSEYAIELFDFEISLCPRNERSSPWLEDRARMVEERIVKHALSLSNSPFAFVAKLTHGGLTYHLPEAKMREAIRAALKPRLEEPPKSTLIPLRSPAIARILQAPPAGPVERENAANTNALLQPTSPQPPPIRSTVGQQIRRLREEARMTIEDLASEVGLASRNVRRHEAGESQVRSKNVREYERVFSKRLKRMVVLETSGQCQRPANVP